MENKALAIKDIVYRATLRASPDISIESACDFADCASNTEMELANEVYELTKQRLELLEALNNLLIACPDETFHDGARLKQEQVARLNGTILMAKAIIDKITRR